MEKLAFNQTPIVRIRLVFYFLLSTFVFPFLFSSCDQQDDPQVDPGEEITSIKGSENLGSGYDVFENYAEVLYVKAPILDLNKLQEDGLIEKKKIEYGDFLKSSGNTIEEYCTSLRVSAGLKGKYMYFSGAVKTNFTQERYEKDEYAFATVKSLVEKTQLRLPLDMTAEDLKPYLTAKAMSNLNDPSVTTDYIFRTYGTHCLTGVALGGRIDYSISAKSSDLSSSKSIGVYAEASFHKRGVSVDGYVDVVNDEEYSSFMNSREERLKIYGGLAESGQDIINENDYEKWVASVDEHQVFCNFTQNGLLPIWELCDDQTRKDELIAAFSTWASDREITVIKVPRLGILDIKVINSSRPSESIIENGIKYFQIPIDLNKGCGGDSPYLWIYYALGYENDERMAPIAEICTLDPAYPETKTVDDLPGDGWVKIARDLNEGASGHYIYLAYRRRSSDDDHLLTGLRVELNNDPTSSKFSQYTDINNTWNAVTQGYEGVTKKDLNEGAKGAFIYLYYTRDKLVTN